MRRHLSQHRSDQQRQRDRSKQNKTNEAPPPRAVGSEMPAVTYLEHICILVALHKTSEGIATVHLLF
jgi:hypothetical protein